MREVNLIFFWSKKVIELQSRDSLAQIFRRYSSTVVFYGYRAPIKNANILVFFTTNSSYMQQRKEVQLSSKKQNVLENCGCSRDECVDCRVHGGWPRVPGIESKPGDGEGYLVFVHWTTI